MHDCPRTVTKEWQSNLNSVRRQQCHAFLSHRACLVKQSCTGQRLAHAAAFRK
jgi:hypothetical protein